MQSQPAQPQAPQAPFECRLPNSIASLGLYSGGIRNSNGPLSLASDGGQTADQLILTLAHIDDPSSGELDEEVGHVAITEPYTLRIALASENHDLAVGVIHSHPENCAPHPSAIDDDMDRYYGSYFNDFAPNRPYVSLIFSKIDGELALSGRVRWQSKWLQVQRFAIEHTPIRTWIGGQ